MPQENINQFTKEKRKSLFTRRPIYILGHITLVSFRIIKFSEIFIGKFKKIIIFNETFLEFAAAYELLCKIIDI